MGWGIVGIGYCTLLSGGLVAGLNAGAQYNTFLLMGGKWISDFSLFVRHEDRTENLVTVRFNHRYLAITTATLMLVFVAKSWSLVTRRQRIALLA